MSYAILENLPDKGDIFVKGNLVHLKYDVINLWFMYYFLICTYLTHYIYNTVGHDRM